MEAKCNKLNSALGVCQGCKVLSILGEKTTTKQDVDLVANRISREYCPPDSGGIDSERRAVIYNYRPDASQKNKQSIW